MADVTAFEFATDFEASFLVPRSYPFEFNASGPPTPAVAIAPLAPATIITTQPIVIDVTVTLPTTISRLIVTVDYDALQLLQEVAFKGLAFSPAFSGKSTITPLPTGFRLSIQRNTGWPASPRVSVLAVSDVGGVNA